MSTPKISVIVPVYNAEKYLRRCIDSILAQTFTDFELLLIDDGSKDCSGAICDEYAEKDWRIRVFHKKNGGAAEARNVGIGNARGEWMTFIDADDIVEFNFLKSISQGFDKEADMIVGCEKVFYDRTNSEFQEQYNLPVGNVSIRQFVGSKYVWESVSKAIKYSFINGQVMFHKLKVAEDTCFYLSICSLNPRIYVPKHLEKSAYIYYSIPSNSFIDKYQMPVCEAVSTLIYVMEKYYKLNMQIPEFERFPNTMFELTKDDLYENGNLWFSNRNVFKILMKSGIFLGAIRFLFFVTMFVPGMWSFWKWSKRKKYEIKYNNNQL